MTLTITDWRAIENCLEFYISDHQGVSAFEEDIAEARAALVKVRREIAALEPPSE